MSATYLKEYLETFNKKGVSSPQAFAINALIDLIGKHYSHSAEAERLYATCTTIAERIEERTHCPSWELEDLLEPLLEIAFEKIADAYAQGFKDAMEDSLEMAELTI